MNYAKIIELKGLQLAKVSFYTVWIEENDNPEFVDFSNRMYLNPKNKDEFEKLEAYIIKIGNQYGASKRYFHHEAAADALSVPFVEHIDIYTENNDFGLRLYCLRLSESIVVLFNGDRKTTQKAQDCPDCAKYFRLAQRLAKFIDIAIREDNIFLDGKELLIDEHFELFF